MIETIYNFRAVSPTLATAGQPDEDELRAIAKAGYEVVINLGLAGAAYSVPAEREIIESGGLQYIHIPVSFETPEIEKYVEFAGVFKAMSARKVFVHCAANKRVSVFLALYQITEEGVAVAEAMEAVELIWEPNEVWAAFMKKILTAAA